MRKLAIVASLLAVAGLTVVSAGALANRGGGGHGNNNFRANLNGYNEVVGGPGAGSTGSVSTTGHGRLTLRIFSDHIHYVLDYSDMSGGTVSGSHIHFAQQHVGGGISAPLCGGAQPPCTTPNGHIESDITSSGVIGPTDQGIAPGELNELVAAIRAGATYVNVHSTPSYPEGEIRGQIVRGHGHGDGGGHQK